MIIERILDPSALAQVAALEAATFTNPWSLEMLQAEMHRNEHARIYVVRMPETPVAAFCSCWIIADELHINTIAVEPHFRRQGFATRLMHHVMAEAVRAGARRATLEVRSSNDAARRLYTSLGFSVAGIRRGYYTQPDEDALILWCDTLAAAASPERSDADVNS